jgi:NTP pyrophosphatase (non-canonical NTP hydrolase)
MATSVEHLADTIVDMVREEFPGINVGYAQVLGVAEEAGEFVGAFRRWAGLARRTGTRDDMELELADVVIFAYSAAKALDIDLADAINRKAEIIMSRGWKDAR